MKISNLLLLGFVFILACRTSDPPPHVVVVPPTIDRDISINTGSVTANSAKFNYWRHHPIHPDNRASVQFELAVEEPNGISKVELLLFEYELYRNEQGLPSKRRRPSGQWGLVKTWDQQNISTLINLSYTYVPGFPARTNVVYLFRVYNSDGELSEQMASFDAGDSPWPQDKILLYGGTEESLQHTINICFFPDSDYGGDWDQFLRDLDTLIYQGYHQNNLISGVKPRWRFYYTQTETDGYALSQDFGNPERYPPFMKDSLIYGIDAFGLLHRQPYSDGAYMTGNIHFLSHNVFTSESYNLGTAVHETAHAVFNLSDEYEGCACFEAPEGGSNMFRSLADCQAFNTENSFSDPSCSTIISYSGQEWFMPERSVMFESEAACLAFNAANGYSPDSCFIFIDIDGNQYYRSEQGVCIMQDDGDRQVRPFQRTCQSIIENYYDRLPPMGEHRERVQMKSVIENVFQYEPVVLMEFTLAQNDLKVKAVSKTFGLPEKNLTGYRDLQMDVIDSKGKIDYHLEMDRPDCMHFEGGEKDSLVILNYGKICLAVPDCKGLDKVICQSKSADMKTRQKTFKLGAQVKKMKLKK